MPALRGAAGGFCAGLDHAHHVDLRMGFAQERQGGGSGRVAGDDEELDAPGRECGGRFEGVAAHRLHALGAVGHAGGVAKVEEGLVGELFTHGAEHSHAAHAGIEEADGQFAQMRMAGGQAVGSHHASASL